MREFVDFKTLNTSNLFGQFNDKFYPATKHHVGTDFRVNTGTPIVAPCDGVMFKTQYNDWKGVVGIFVFTWEGKEWALELCHLRELPVLKNLKEGEVMAYSGNTGHATTGPHLHAVLHKDAKVTKNYQELVDEKSFIRLWREGRIQDPYLWFWREVNSYT